MKTSRGLEKPEDVGEMAQAKGHSLEKPLLKLKDVVGKQTSRKATFVDHDFVMRFVGGSFCEVSLKWSANSREACCCD